MEAVDPGDCKCMEMLASMAVACRVYADVSNGDNLCGVPEHPDAPSGCLHTFGIHVAQAHPSGCIWWSLGVFYVDPKDKCSVPCKEWYAKNLGTDVLAVRMLCGTKARQVCSESSGETQIQCLMGYCFLRALPCHCLG